MKITMKPLLAAGAAALLLAGCATGPYYSDYSYGAGYGYAPGYAYDSYYPYYGPSVGLGYTYYDNDYRGRYSRDRDWRDNRADRDRVRESRRVEAQPNYYPGRTIGPDYTPRNHAGEPLTPADNDVRNDHGQKSPG